MQQQFDAAQAERIVKALEEAARAAGSMGIAVELLCSRASGLIARLEADMDAEKKPGAPPRR